MTILNIPIAVKRQMRNKTNVANEPYPKFNGDIIDPTNIPRNNVKPILDIFTRYLTIFFVGIGREYLFNSIRNWNKRMIRRIIMPERLITSNGYSSDGGFCTIEIKTISNINMIKHKPRKRSFWRRYVDLFIGIGSSLMLSSSIRFDDRSIFFSPKRKIK